MAITDTPFPLSVFPNSINGGIVGGATVNTTDSNTYGSTAPPKGLWVNSTGIVQLVTIDGSTILLRCPRAAIRIDVRFTAISTLSTTTTVTVLW